MDGRACHDPEEDILPVREAQARLLVALERAAPATRCGDTAVVVRGVESPGELHDRPVVREVACHLFLSVAVIL